MTILTKYSIDSEIWFLAGNKVINHIVTKVSVTVTRSIHAEVVYFCSDNSVEDGGYYINESSSFPSKEDLIKSL